jgi:glycerate 2-kinase
MKSYATTSARRRTLACPASLKGVLSARHATAALAEGLRTWSHVDELPVADGGEGTLDVLQSVFGAEWRSADVHDAFGRPRRARWLQLPRGEAAVEAAEVIPLDPSRLDPLAASSRGLGELIRALGAPTHLYVGLGGTATVDGGAGLLEVLDELPGPTRVLCDVTTTLYDAPRLFGPQKGATPEQVAELEMRFRGIAALAPYADLPGSGAAGGLGAALASLGAELVRGAEAVLDLLRFDPSPYDVVVTGEGTVDRTTWEGKAPAVVARRCAEAGARCVVFGGRVLEGDAEALSGDPARAEDDLVELGERLGVLVRGA